MAACDTRKMILFVGSVLWDLDIPQEAATLLYEDNNACTPMGNVQKPTSCTQHMDIKYFSLSKWVEQDLVILDQIDTLIKMANHMTKALQPILFHRHADFLLGHVPPMYSPIYESIVGVFTNHSIDIDFYVPESFTTPITAAAARIYAPTRSDCQHSPWLSILGHGQDIMNCMYCR
jgi:hypothetical protein